MEKEWEMEKVMRIREFAVEFNSQEGAYELLGESQKYDRLTEAISTASCGLMRLVANNFKIN